MLTDEIPPIAWLTTGPVSRRQHLVLAHGAGAPMTSPVLERLARRLDQCDITVHRFEFPYMAGRRHGLRRPPPRADLLVPRFREALADCRKRLVPTGAHLYAGGKSMGGVLPPCYAESLAWLRALLSLAIPFIPRESQKPPGSRRCLPFDVPH